MDLLWRRGKPAQISSMFSAVLFLLNLKRNEVWSGTGSLKPVLHFLSLEQPLFFKGSNYLPGSYFTSRSWFQAKLTGFLQRFLVLDETLIKRLDALICVPLTSPDRLEARFWLKHGAVYAEAKDSGFHSPFPAWIRVCSRWALVLCSALFK